MAAKHAEKVLEVLKERDATPEDYMSYPGYVPIRMGWMAWIELALGHKEKARGYFEKMEQSRPCVGCGYQKCFESSLWLAFYYYTEGDYEKAASLLAETLKRNPEEQTAEYLLQKMQGGAGSLLQTLDGRTLTQETGSKQGLVARLFHRKPEK